MFRRRSKEEHEILKKAKSEVEKVEPLPDFVVPSGIALVRLSDKKTTELTNMELTFIKRIVERSMRISPIIKNKPEGKTIVSLNAKLEEFFK